MKIFDPTKSAPDFDAHVHFRPPSDLMPAVLVYVRSRGLPSAAWLRMVILEVLNRSPSDKHEKAA